MNRLTWTEKFLCFCAVAAFVLITMILSYEPTRRYRLPNGDIVECSSMVETSKGNFLLSGCDNGSEYFVTGSVERIK
jgi:hypothetical protein